MMCWTLHQDGRGKAIRAAVAVEDEVYCFGGLSHSDHRHQVKVHIFSLVSLRWRTLPLVAIEEGGERTLEIPSRIHSRVGRRYTAVLVERAIFLLGGCGRRRLFAFDVDTHHWLKNEVSGTVPKAAYGHGACVSGKVVYIHGGWNRLTEWVYQMYKLDTSTMVWSSIINAEYNVASLYSLYPLYHSTTIIGTKMFVCGSDGPDYVSAFDTATNRWLPTPDSRASRARSRRQGVWPCHLAFAYNGELCIINHHDGRLRKFCPETLSWMKASRAVPGWGQPKGNCPSSLAVSYCCVVGDRVILIGGENKPDDLHLLDLRPSLRTLCELVVIQYDLEQSGLPHNIRWELSAMSTTNDDTTQQEQRTNSSPGNKRKRED